MEYSLMIIKIDNREGTAQKVQNVLTRHGCLIKVRLGLHDVPADACSSAGLLVLQVVGPDQDIRAFQAELAGIADVAVQLVKI